MTNTPMFHSDSEKLRRKFLTTKSFSSDQTCHIEKKKKFDIVCDMTFICPQLDFGIHVIGSTPLLLLHYLIEKTGDSTHRRTCHWGRGAATPPSPHPSKFWATQIFGAAREIWGNQIFTKVSMFRFVFFFSLKELFYISVQMVQIADSCCVVKITNDISTRLKGFLSALGSHLLLFSDNGIYPQNVSLQCFRLLFTQSCLPLSCWNHGQKSKTSWRLSMRK